MTVQSAAPSERDFSGVITGYLIAFLRAQTGDALSRVFALAGDTRAPESLVADTTWSTYAQVRRLLEATASLLGGPEVLVRAGAAFVVSNAEFAALVQSMGGPDTLMANIAQMSEHTAPALGLATEEIAPGEWIADLRFRDGFEPFAEYCHFCRGMLASGTMAFGLPPADVVEEACQRQGAPACRFRVRWTPTDGPAARAVFFERRTQILEARLESFQRTVADIVSGDDLEHVLTRIVASTAAAVSAPAYVLALEELPDAAQRVYSEGLSVHEAALVADDLLAESTSAGAGEIPGRLVVDVASPVRRYGRLAAIHLQGGRFFVQETMMLQVYARLAAAALDSATALAEARTQARAANALLTLSSSLAEVVGVDEVAGKLVRAVREVVDCDRSSVILVDPETGLAQIAATDGYPPELDAELRALQFSAAQQREWLAADAHFSTGTDLGTDPDGHSSLSVVLSRHRIAGIAYVPISANGEILGWLAASVTDRATRLANGHDVTARLRGIAGQAATAVRNARLLDQIRHQALHDALTGLPNRALILDRVEQLLARTRRNRSRASVLFLDLDGFKEINDTLGHAAGDQLLRGVAARLSACLRPSDTIGRLGGDEFIILVESEHDGVSAELVAERLHAALQESFQIAETTVSVTASIGIADGDRPSPGDMLRDADIALYQAKADGKNRAVVFRPEMHAAVREHHQVESDLRMALPNDELFLVYQPIWDLASTRVTGVEALLRWRHPTKGIVPPDRFIPQLEETGMIIEVGAWVVRTACRDLQALRAQGLFLDVAVNVSGRQLDDDAFVGVVEDALAETGFDPNALIIEITESVIMRDPEATAARLRALRALGIRVAIDDFGTGYSSLGLLRQFPVDSLKIDRSFIGAMLESTEAEALVRMLVQLGRTLGLEMVAEGIELDAQLCHLRTEECESGQGFLLARPLELGPLTEFLTAETTSIASFATSHP
jgi:diguanylate cyclase (GGDEF)-like protein